MVELSQKLPRNDHGEILIHTWFEQRFKPYVAADSTLSTHCLQVLDVLEAHNARNEFTDLGDSCLERGLWTAEYLCELNIDAISVIAALIYPLYQQSKLPLNDLADVLNPELRSLIQGLAKIDVVYRL